MARLLSGQRTVTQCQALEAKRREGECTGNGLEELRVGCQVGARDENGNLAYKAWTIMTSCPLMETRMSLKCPKNHPHAQLEGSAVTRSAYYPEPMARRIVDVILTSG